MTSADSAARSEPLRSLLFEMHLLAPERFAERAAVHARALGFAETVMYVVDYGQLLLQPLPGEGVPEREGLSVEGSVAGQCYRRVETIRTPGDDGGRRLWVPLLDGVDRLGVVELLTDVATDEVEETANAYVSLLAELLTVNHEYTDVFTRLRRRQTMSLAAEIQWELLPPLTFATDRVVVSGVLEPTYEIGGDSFDYAVNGSSVDVMVLDAVGHGLPAALLATAAIGAYRHARRELHDLPDIVAAINRVVAENFAGSQFATAAVARLDLDTGQFRWVNAGHPDPLVLRDGAFVRPPVCRPQPPLGLQVGVPEVCEMQLHPGDRVLVYSDGIVEARSVTGEFFGEERLADFVLRAGADGDAAPEALRRLMRNVLEHQGGHLQDDASIVVLEWRTGTPQHLLP